MSGDSPIVGPKSADQLRAFVAEPEPPTATRDQVDVMIGKLAMATAQSKVSPVEADGRLDLYWLALNDVPVADLRWAFTELLRGSKFLPTPAEVRTKALQPGCVRKYAKSRARHLVWKHETEWRPAAELLAPDEAKALLATINYPMQEAAE